MRATVPAPDPAGRGQAPLLPRTSLPLQAFLIAAMTLAVYWPALRGGYLWDDDLYAANPVLEQPGALARIWTLGDFTDRFYYKQYPMVYSVFWLGRRVWGAGPAGFHLLNVVLHIANALLAWLLLRRLGLRWAWLAGAVFALHPVHVESVAWVTELKNVLSGLFFLLALLAYGTYEERSRRRWYWGALALFAGALTSKSVTVTFPAVVLLLRWLKGARIGRKEVADLAPFFLLSLAAGLFTAWIEVDPKNLETSLAPAQRLLLAARALWFYPLKLLLPMDLCFSYERWPLKPGDPAAWAWVGWSLAAGAAAWRFRNALGRVFFAGLGFYVLNISLFLGLISIYTFRYSFAADHYQYLPSLGLIALAAAGLERASRAARETGRLVVLACAAGLLVLATAAWRQSATYRSPGDLWDDVLAKNPGSRLALISKGQGLSGEPALEYWERVLTAHPGFYEAHTNLAAALANMGRRKEAKAHFLKSLELNPGFSTAHDNLARMFAAEGDHARAAAHYRELLKIDPGYGRARNDYGLSLLALRDPREAEVQFRKATILNPSEAGARNNLGLALYAQGNVIAAAAAFRDAVRMDPELAQGYHNLGMALYAMGNAAEGDLAFMAAVERAPGNAQFHADWGAATASVGRTREAVDHFRRALSLDPRFPGLKRRLEELRKRGG